MVAAGDNLAISDLLLALNRRVATASGTDADVTAASYASETVVDTVTASVVAGRTYRIKWVFQWNAASASSVTLRTRIRLTGTSGAQLTYRDSTNATTTPSEVLILEVDWTAGATGSQVFVGTAIRQAGTASSQFRGATSQSRSLTVEYAYG
jgi:hypothetical protein